MLGLPPWLWGLVGVLLVVFVTARAFYARFRRMCRGVREDLTRFLETQHPEVEVLREEQGNLVLRMADGSERVWELADVYTEVARLPGLGADPEQRAAVYRQAAATLLAPAPDSGPLTLATHGDWIKPQLLRPEALSDFPPDAGVLHSPLEGTGLETVYVLDLPQDPRYLTAQDLGDLGIDMAELHRRALEKLRKDFPREMVTTPLAGEGSAVHFHDGFDAARLLVIPDLLEPGQELVALIPHQDMLLLLPADTAEDPEKLREGLRQMDCGDHPPLLDHPLRVTSDGFQVLQG